MRKLIESTFVSLDGVIDDTRPSTASRAEPQNWCQPYWDADHMGTLRSFVRRARLSDTLTIYRQRIGANPDSALRPGISPLRGSP